MEKVTFLLSVINPDMCVKCYGMDRHAARRGGQLGAAAPCAAPAVSSLADSARPLTVRRDWRAAAALQCLLSKARHHCTAATAAAVDKLAVWGNF